MRWSGGGDEAPLALVGKGVVFDTGGISIKPAAGMEEMTMDMGGAGVVAGVMRALALRKAKANVVGIVGLVENMPDGRAQRPGDVVRSMKGDTVEVINTDAEGRLVLADVLWYVQERFKPAAMIDLATLTGAIIIALGHENAGVFANDDALAAALLAAATGRGRGRLAHAARPAYDKKLKSRIADIERRRPRRGLDHRGPVPPALRQAGHAVGASRHRRRRLVKEDGDLRPGARPAGACGRSTGWCGTASRAEAVARSSSTTSPRSRSSRTLPELLEKCLARGWRAVVRCGSEPERLAMLDARALDLPRRQLPAARHRRRRARRAPAGLPHLRRGVPERRRRC
jgi:hypothetical protein